MDEQINKMSIYIQWNIQPQKESSGTHYSWMNLEDIMVSKVSQSQKDKYCDSTYMGVSIADKFRDRK